MSDDLNDWAKAVSECGRPMSDKPVSDKTDTPRILMLPSEDGSRYTKIFVVDEEKLGECSDSEISRIARKALRTVERKSGYSFERQGRDVLEREGFKPVNIIEGPVWD
jgi:hypothetical protein